MAEDTFTDAARAIGRNLREASETAIGREATEGVRSEAERTKERVKSYFKPAERQTVERSKTRPSGQRPSAKKNGRKGGR